MLDLFKFVVILGVTIFLLTRKWDLGLILLLDTGLAAILFNYPFLSLIQSIFRGLTAKDTWNLAGAVFLVLLLAELMRRTNAMERMVASLSSARWTRPACPQRSQVPSRLGGLDTLWNMAPQAGQLKRPVRRPTSSSSGTSMLTTWSIAWPSPASIPSSASACATARGKPSRM